MNSYDRILKTFKREAVDKVPVFHIGFSSYAASLILNREAYIGGGIQQWREASSLWNGEEAHEEFLDRSYSDAFEISNVLDMDMVRTDYWRFPVKPWKKIDDYNFVFGNEDCWTHRRFDPLNELFEIVDSRPKKKETTFEDLEKELEEEEAELNEFHPTPKDFPGARRALEFFGEEKPIRGGAGEIWIPLENIWMEAIYLRPDLVRKTLRIHLERAKKEIKCLSDMGARFIFGGGDLASTTGPVYSPAIFREFVQPCIREITEFCHNMGLYYLYNSDGNLWPLANDLFGESGVDGYYEVDRLAGMDLEKLRTQFPKLTLIGNISSITLHVGSRSQVIEETLSCLETAKKYNGVIVGCSNYLVPGTPMENIIAMVDTLQKNRAT